MIQLQLKFCGIKFRNGCLFNKYSEFPLIGFDFLIVGITYWPDGSNAILMNALEGLAQDKDWVIKNAPSVRLERKKTWKKARAQAESMLQDDVDYYCKTMLIIIARHMMRKEKKLIN